MVRAVAAIPRNDQEANGRSARGARRVGTARLVFVALLVVSPGCGIVPRSRMDECQRLTQTLRSENARMKDRVLALQGQNRDYAERAVDDAKRLAIQDEAIERLEHSVQAYQDERTRLEAAYQQLVSNLGAGESTADGRTSQPAARSVRTGESQPPATARRPGTPTAEGDATGPR
jgi:hypothetical protein